LVIEKSLYELVFPLCFIGVAKNTELFNFIFSAAFYKLHEFLGYSN
jgi:hypothetical protein